jgi:lipase
MSATHEARLLHVRSFGAPGGRELVCLHGVTGWGGHFEGLGELLGPGYRVLAPDLLGHGDSPREPPWRIDQHVESVAASIGPGRRTWIGHSFGGRIAFEHAATRPGDVDRLVLLDPAIFVPGHVALLSAENARAERRYASFAEAVDRRFDESQLHGADRERVAAELEGHLEETGDGWRYRYSQAAVVTAYGDVAVPPPPFGDVRIPTLLVLGEDSYLSYDHLLDAHREAIGDLLRVVTVPGGHTVLWDAPSETATAIAAFLEES